MDAGAFPRGCLAETERQPGAGAAVRRHQHHPVVLDFSVARDVPQRPAPEVQRPPQVRDAQHDRSDARHAPIFAETDADTHVETGLETDAETDAGTGMDHVEQHGGRRPPHLPDSLIAAHGRPKWTVPISITFQGVSRHLWSNRKSLLKVIMNTA